MKLGRITVAGYVIGMVVGLGLVLTYGAVEVSSTPTFCGSCHIMEPYYDSWVGSSHEDIACVECHIPPGITAELQKKYEALSMVARYFTGTYGTNPWAEVDDTACLECHDRRLLPGAELFGDVLFDHQPHLSELRRGKRLQCTSCHSQIVQGSHITVTTTSCILCHFKGQQAGQGTAECTLCHQVPDRVIDSAGLEFDHGDVSRFGMACVSCHTPPAPDAGGVPRERCLTCHNEPDRLAEYEDGDLLHQTHVTDHKVECTNCHLEIQHVAPRHLEAAQSECSACHAGRHSPQRDLYAGIAGKGVPPMPDVMFRAGVRCEGCHFNHDDAGTSTAGAVSCMSCHGPSYRGLFLSWSESVGERSSAIRRAFDDTVRRLGATDSLADAQANLELVENGQGIHNVPYSLALLGAAHREINTVRTSRGLSAFAAAWPQAPYETPCLECHAGVEGRVARSFGRQFPHLTHVVELGQDCESCHRPHDEWDDGGPLRLSAGDCTSCHHQDAARSCLDCHADTRRRTWPTELGDFSHAVHSGDMELECSTCHGSSATPRRPASREACADCH